MDKITWTANNLPVSGRNPLLKLSQDECDKVLRSFLRHLMRHNERFERQVIDGEVVYAIYCDDVAIGEFRIGHLFDTPQLWIETHLIAHERAIEQYGRPGQGRWPDGVRKLANRMMYIYYEALRTLYEHAKLPNPRKFQSVTISPDFALIGFIFPQTIADLSLKRVPATSQYAHRSFLLHSDASLAEMQSVVELVQSAVMAGQASISDTATTGVDDGQAQTKEGIVSTPDEIFAWGVLAEGVRFLFNQADQFLKERREKRKANAESTAAPSTDKSASSTVADVQPISSADELLEVLNRKVHFATREAEVKRVDQIMKELKTHTDSVGRYRIQAGRPLSPTELVSVQDRIDWHQGNIVALSLELRSLLEKLSEQRILIEALDAD